jgi:transcriptional regulator with XRE-family HTH domain
MSWLGKGKHQRRLVAQERLLLDASEAVVAALTDRGKTRKQLADLLGVRASEITQRLSGGRNLTLRTLAEMLDALDYEVRIRVVDRQAMEPSGLTTESAIHGLGHGPFRNVSIFTVEADSPPIAAAYQDARVESKLCPGRVANAV